MPSFGKNTTGAEVVSQYKDFGVGKTFVITGPSSRTIGGGTAVAIAACQPKQIILAGRTESKIAPVIEEIQKIDPKIDVKYIQLDLADLKSVRRAASEILSLVNRVDYLINNAGIMAVKDFTKSPDGIELHFAANHIGHFLLTKLLLPKIGTGSRIINLSSLGYMSGGVRFDDYNFGDGQAYNPWLGYSQSKTANILFTKSLAAKLKTRGIIVLTLNPGLIVDTQLMNAVTPEMFAEGYRIAVESLDEGEAMDVDMDPKPFDAGYSTTCWAALSPELTVEQSGSFLENCSIRSKPLKVFATSEENQSKLWELSEKLIGETFEI